MLLNLTAEAPTYRSRHLEHVIIYIKLILLQLTQSLIRFTSACTNKGIMESHIISENITVVATFNTNCSSLYFLMVTRWCYQFSQIFISFINSNLLHK